MLLFRGEFTAFLWFHLTIAFQLKIYEKLKYALWFWERKYHICFLKLIMGKIVVLFKISKCIYLMITHNIRPPLSLYSHSAINSLILNESPVKCLYVCVVGWHMLPYWFPLSLIALRASGVNYLTITDHTHPALASTAAVCNIIGHLCFNQQFDHSNVSSTTVFSSN